MIDASPDKPSRFAISIALTVFTISQGELRILLIRKKNLEEEGGWALPCSRVEADESLKHAAWRALRDQTGSHTAYLEQVHAFGHPSRDPRHRAIAVAYLALIPEDRLTVAHETLGSARWFDVASLPELVLDHSRILARARHRLGERIAHSPIVFELLPETFTLPELRRAVELIGGESLDRRNFRKQMLKAGLIVSTGAVSNRGTRRPAKLYRAAESVLT